MPFAPGVAESAARRSSAAALLITALVAVAAMFLVAAPLASAKKALPGGVSARSGIGPEIPESTEPTEVPPTETGETEIEGETGTAAKARLVGSRAIAPASAPPMVKRVIAAANRIRTTPYIWGGGHGRWQDSGYDCSGAVSYALHGGKLLTSPLTSGSFETFGEAGPGRWITIYANASHAYMVVAGLRFDTAGNLNETGPRWHPTVAAAARGSYVARHPIGY
jgi:cell wall-associated NlpC family hydrolase